MLKKTAISAIRLAGQSLTKNYHNFDRNKVDFKAKNEIVTQADLKSEKIIIQTIKKKFPEHQFLAEESGKSLKKSDYLWIIDPLDGTTNFSIHNPLWSISLALAFKNKLILGLIYIPLNNELFIAEINKGAYLNNKKIKVSNNKRKNVIHTFCHARDKKYVKQAINYYQKQKLNSLDCRQLGSAAVEMAYVACGRIESITIPGANAWDVAAGALLVNEAKGKVTDFKNREWKINSENIIASNKLTHSSILKILKN
jgi:myo-inositol-1(or 4)-monophosphatase